MDDFAVLLGEALGIVDIPAEFAEHGVDEIDAELGFVIIGRADLVALPVEMIDQTFDASGAIPMVNDNHRPAQGK